MKKLNELLKSKMSKALSIASVTAVFALLITFSMWGGNKTCIKVGPSLAVIGMVASAKAKKIELDADELKTYGAFDEVLENLEKGLLSKEDAEKQFKELKEKLSPEALKALVDAANVEVTETLAKQAIALDQLKTLGIGGPGNVKSLRDQIKEQLEKPENKSALDAFKQKSASAKGFELQVKAAGTMTTAGTTAYTTAATAMGIPQPEFIPGLNNIARNQPFILQVLNVKPTQKANIVYTEKYNPQGAAGMLGEGAATPEVSFDIRIGESRAKMIGAFIKVSIQMLDDIDYIAAEIENELIYQVAISLDTNLYSGNGAGDNLAGITSFVGGYVLTGANAVYTTLPNACDVVMACATQIAHDNFRPDIALLNPIDYNQTKMLKGTTGYYLINPNVTNESWDGILIVRSNQVPVGRVLVMDSSKTNVFRYQDFTLSYGWVNDDFTKNLVTINAHQRIHSFIKNNDTNAFVEDSIANVKAAITAI